MTENSVYGWEFGAGTTVTLKGVFAYDNDGGGSNNTKLDSGHLVIVRSYP